MKNTIGNFMERHPFLTYWIVMAAITAPANIIRALKWDGRENGNSVNLSLPSKESSLNEDDTQVDSVEESIGLSESE